MAEFITFTVIGLATGAIYSIASAGLVVTYTTSGIFNFAHGAIGMFSAFIYWQLRWDEGWGGQWPAPIALLFVLLVVAPVVGILLQVLVMRGLEGTSETTKLVIPIAVMLGFIGLTNWVWQGAEQRIPKPFFGRNAKWSIGDAFITWHQTIIVIVAISLAIALRFLLFNTRTGVLMRAVVDNTELVKLNGGRPDRAALLSWAIGAMMAAVAGILISPLLGGLGVLALTLLVVNAYAAAIFGRLRNLPLTFIGGLIIGVSVSYWNWISGTGRKWPWLSELRTTLPILILFVILLLLPQERLRGNSIVNTRERFSISSGKSAVLWSLVFLAVVSGLSLIITSKWEALLTRGITMGIIGLSMVLLTGYAGEINLAPLAFAGIGAIAAFQFDVGSTVETGAGFATLAVLLAVVLGVLIFPTFGYVGKRLLAAIAAFALVVFILVAFFDQTTGSGIASRESMSLTGLVVAALISGSVGVLVALPALRLRGLYLGLATFAFAIFVDKMVYKQRQSLSFDIPFIGDSQDITINLFNNGALNIPRPAFLGIDFVQHQSAMLIFVTAIFSLLAVGLVKLRRSSYGRQLAAMKDSPAACATLGMNIRQLKLSVFTLAAAIAGFGGALHASNLRTIQEDYPFTIWEGLALFMLTVVGGIGYISGALIGGIVYACAFIVMGDFWGKLASDWGSFSWLFTVMQDFFLLLGPALAGIGLGKNPNGIASEIFDGFRILRRRDNWFIVVVGTSCIITAWALRLANIYNGWIFLLISLSILFIMPVVGDAKRHRSSDKTAIPLEMAGIEYPFNDELIADLNTQLELNLPMPHSDKKGD
ncbi:MAG: ABC transporter permease [Acidimicrobiaceae bacterium]|nr:ABC transporter permease [Acidimicrobiaceae bacterium]